MRHAFAAFFMCLLSSAVSAQVTVPNTFTAGGAARASEVNANFNALATAINDLATRVSALETPTITAASVAGTYKYLTLEVGVIAATVVANSGHLQVTAARGTGTFVLNAGGTGTVSTNDSSTNARITVGGGSPASVTTAFTRDTGPESNSATWTVSNGELVITTDVAMNFVPASSRLFFATASQQSSQDFYSLHILVKQ